ncbi:MAG TPA: response regulator, partial [Candidatus Acidoferrales bacterium]|nr:response regulator [Candidatus Acidoferrales bacterium]
MKKSGPNSEAPALVDGGEMGERIRAFDWAKTPIGPIESWSPALRMMTSFLLANRFPLLLWWGPQFIQIYNDAYRPVLGTKHPDPGLGRPLSECWSEIWHVLRPLVETPFNGGPATWMEDIFLEVNRHGFVEETHFTIAYSPVPDETAQNGIGGVLATVHEITEKVVSERRITLLRDLGAQSADAKTRQEACQCAAKTLTDARDVPFALFYLLDADRKIARLAAASGISMNTPASPALIRVDGVGQDKTWPAAKMLETEQVHVVENLRDKFPDLPRGPWPDPPHSAAIVPIRSNIQHHLAGFIIAGLSPRHRFDTNYRAFLELMSTQVATAVANAHAYEEERKRAEALAELDRAKTVFFSNVSHEFRTPLSLMLGPLEESLSAGEGVLPKEVVANLNVAHRNSLRLLKLVNSLLEFSRIEAGRIEANYEPTDLAGYTLELASLFRSAVEKAGLRLVLDCPPLAGPLFVDHEMWEKIVLNLLSNAFKFTFEGEIKVKLSWHGDYAELCVSDTGAGIPADEMPKLFTRFNRVRVSRARTHEGTGIGLALVQELARLHGGEVKAESWEGQGSTFFVTVKSGQSHLPPNQICSRKRPAASFGVPFVEEALRWLPTAQGAGVGRDSGSALLAIPGRASTLPRARVLLADDNADMREYVSRILAAHFTVETMADGEAALRSIQASPPDLVLTDVMMPRLDGFGLLRKIRADDKLKIIPVIMLSARAGEEARVDGLDAGANDYLIKPFTARELLARVQSQLELARQRRDAEKALRESEERFRVFVTTVSDVVYRMSADWTEMRYLHGAEFIADSLASNQSWLDKYIHPDDQKSVLAVIHRAIQTRSPFQLEHRVIRADGTLGWTFSRAIPIFDEQGEIVEWFGAATDISSRKEAEQKLAESLEREKAARAEAEAAARAKDDFLAMLSHELRTPLNPVLLIASDSSENSNLPA